MTNATFEREHLIGSLIMVSRGSSMIILAVNQAAGRRGAGEIAEIFYLIQKLEEERQRDNMGKMWGFETHPQWHPSSKMATSPTPSQNSPPTTD